MWHKFFSKFAGAGLSSACALMISPVVIPMAWAQTDLAQLEEMWKRGDYERSLPGLLNYRERTGTKNANIDYMIATSACRITSQRQAGNEFFDWILYNYNLNSDNRALVEREKQRCSIQTAPQRFRPMTPATLVGVTYHGKAGLDLRASSSGNSTSEVVEPIANDVLARRLFAIQAADAARVEVTSMLGRDSEVKHVGHFLLVVPPRPAPERSATAETGPSPGVLNAAAIPNRVATPNEPATRNDEGVPRFGVPNIAATPNRSATPNAPARPLNVQAPNYRKPIGVGPEVVRENGVNANGVNQAGVNAANVDPANVNPAGINPTNVSPANVNTAGIDPEGTNQPVSRRTAQAPMMAQQAIHISTDATDIRHVGEDLEKYLRFYTSEYGMRPPSHLITVYFARNIPELQSLARKLHGIQLASGSIGYSFPADQSMAGWADGRSYGTFAHELFHVMVRNNFGDVPPWLDEGMASLYEVSRLDGDRAVGVDNWRSKILRDLWAARPSLKKLVQMNRSAFDVVEGRSDELVAGENQAVNHATARYFMLYLQERGKLKPVYKAFVNRKVKDQPAKQAVDLVEGVLGRSLDDVDADFAQWFRSLS